MQNSADVKELAVAAWRLEKWLDNLNSTRKMAAKSALRSIKKYITALDIEVIDPVGSKFDPGLAIEVVNNESPEAFEENLIIVETLTPYVYQNGELMQHARVIIGTTVKEAKVNKEIVESPSVKPELEKAAAEDRPSAVQNDVKVQEEISIREDDIERMLEYAKIL